MSHAHARPDMSRLPTAQEAFWINEWLHIDPHWFVPGGVPLTEWEAVWLMVYVSYIHSMFRPQVVQIMPEPASGRAYQVRLLYPSHDPAQPPMEVRVHSLEDYTTLLRWAAGIAACFERETEAFPPEQQASEEQRVFTFRRMIYTHLGLFLPEPDKDGEPA